MYKSGVCAIFGKSHSFKRLDISDTEIAEVPRGIEMLVNLEYLKLFNYRLKVRAGELPRSRKLDTFTGHFYDTAELNTYVSSWEDRGLNSYLLVSGDYKDYHEYYTGCERNVLLYGGGNSHVGEGGFIERNERNVYLDGGGNSLILHKDIQWLEIQNRDEVTCLCDGSFENLVFCRIYSCNRMTHLFCSSSCCPFLRKLNDLMEGGTSITSTPLNCIFHSLKDFSVFECHNMKRLFMPSLLSRLQNLETLWVYNCEQMEEIIGGASNEDEDQEATRIIVLNNLPKLKNLKLQFLPELKNFCSTSIVRSNSLEEIVVYRCPKLRRMPLLCEEPNPLPSLQWISVEKEWWESLQWDHPQTKDLCQPFCQFLNQTLCQTSLVVRTWQSSDAARVEKRHKSMDESSQSFPPDNLKQLLIACAKALNDNNYDLFDKLIEKARGTVSICGEPIQRLGAYMVEGMVARKQSSGTNIYRALKCREPESKDLLSYMQILYEICPYLKFGYMAANGAIAEACKNEDRIHIIDFQIAQGTQWMTLLQALAARPSGAPHVRITGIDDPVNQYARGDGLAAVGRRLAAFSQNFNIPVEFNPVPVFAPDITLEMLDVRPGEALAVNFPLQLHHTPDESVDVNNPRDELLRMVKSLSPKIVTLVEQESNTNTTPFFYRFVETLDYYLAMFESIDVTLPRNSKHRINVEQHCLAKDIVNVIACKGKERVERHELFGKWKSRLTMAGFKQYPLSSYDNSVIRSLLKCYSEHYNLVEKDGAMLLGWKERSLISASAWQ